MNKSILSLTLVLAVAAGGAQAERRGIIDRANLNLHTQGSIARQGNQRMPENLMREVTRADAQGETANRSEIVSRDNEAGIASRTISGITADGRTYSGKSVVNATANGLTRERDITDSEGNSRSGSADILIDKEAGKLTKQVNATAANNNGESTSVTGGSVVTRTGDGLTRESAVSDSEGNSRSGSAEILIDKEAGKLTKQVSATTTNNRDESTSVTGGSVVTRTGDGLTRESAASDSEGGSRSGSASVLIDKEAGTVTKTTDVTPTKGEGESTSLTGESRLARANENLSSENQMSESQDNTRSRSLDAKVNKHGGSISQETRASGPNGRASTSTLVTRSK